MNKARIESLRISQEHDCPYFIAISIPKSFVNDLVIIFVVQAPSPKRHVS